MDLILGSRGSQLAVCQTEWVTSRLAEAGRSAEIKIITTFGDRLTGGPLSQPQSPHRGEPGLKGLFIKEIEEALAAGEIDVAVHSLKDMPVDQPPGLTIAAVPPRVDARDALVTRGKLKFTELAPGARVGTTSPRRQSQVLNLRPDLVFEPIRGNVDTRLRKLERGDCDALVMAAAGLRRLGLEDRIGQYFSADQVCSAPGQGALAIEIRAGDERTARAVEALDDLPSRLATQSERAALRCLGGGCRSPIAAYAAVSGDSLEITGAVASVDGRNVIRASVSGPASDPEAVGRLLAEELIKKGANAVMAG